MNLAATENSQFGSFIKSSQDNTHTLTLNISNVRCASCIQKIEQALLKQPNISFARVNMSTNRLTFTWHGDKELSDNFVNQVSSLGFSLSAINTNAVADNLKAEKFLLKCLAVSGFALGNLMMISIGLWSTNKQTMGVVTFNFMQLLSMGISLPAIIYTARPFFTSALTALKHKQTNMDVPISLAIFLASTMSVFEVVNSGEYIYFDSALMLLFFLLIGRYLDLRAKGRAKKVATDLLAMQNSFANVIENKKIISLPRDEVKPGMIVLVAVGENIPVDGKVFKGESAVDISLITGETNLENVKIGSRVYSGTTNHSAPLQILVEKISSDSILNKVIDLLEKALQAKAQYVRLAEKAAKLYTPTVHALSLLTFIVWVIILKTTWQQSLLNAISVLIITCPCALGLAVPIVQVIAISRLMKQGIIIKSGDALEKLANINAVVFDKTGTLTLGKPELLNKEEYSAQILQLAASIAVVSKHPLAKAIQNSYQGELIELDVHEVPGKGLLAIHQQSEIKLGNRAWCEVENLPATTSLELILRVDNKTTQFCFADTLRLDAKEVVKTLHANNIKTVLLSGDRSSVTKEIAQMLGIKDYYAELTPIQKSEHLNKLKAKHKVLMLGDGLNDALAVASADVSISPASAIDITQNTADIVFSGDKLISVIKTWQTAKFSNKLIKQNFAFAVFYNLLAIPLAVTGNVTPLIAAIAMSASSLVVIGNSFRLNLQK